MVQVGRDGRFTQLGVVSYGSAVGCEAGNPSGYARVTSFLVWLSMLTGVDTRTPSVYYY